MSGDDNKKETKDALKEAKKLDTHMVKYLQVAEDVNSRAIGDRDPSRMGIDDFPLGEEEVRIKEASADLSVAMKTLENALSAKPTATPDQVKKAIETVEDVRITVDDVGPAPKVHYEH